LEVPRSKIINFQVTVIWTDRAVFSLDKYSVKIFNKEQIMTISFSAPNNLTAGDRPYSVAIADFNKDGNLDVAVANTGDKTVSILLGDGAGSFNLFGSFSVGSTWNPVSIAVLDLNGDGNLDLASANVNLLNIPANNSDVSIIFGDGTGSFSTNPNYPNYDVSGLSAIALGDFNNDGKLDLAAGTITSPIVSILLGDGLFNYLPSFTYNVGQATRAIALADFNDDGILDLAQVKSGISGVFVGLGSNPGSFGQPTSFNFTKTPLGGFPVGTQPRSVAIADINGDGFLDILVANSVTDDISLLLGDGTGSFGAATYYAAADGSRAVAIADINGDSKLDLVVGNELDDTISVLLNTTTGDAFVGNTGDNYYVVDSIGDTINEGFNGGTDTVRASVTYTLSANVERLTLAGTNNINGTGNDLNNNITGNSGNNILSGKGGNDSLYGDAGDDTLIGGDGNDNLFGGEGTDALIGGNGNDTYFVEDLGDTVTENVNGGIDTVNSSVSFTLSDNVERLTLTGTNNIDGTGNVLNNNLTGNAGNNTLTGNGGNDYLYGNAGDDTLIGGLGNDNLNGGVGNDNFRFNNANEGIDRIQDFVVGNDKIQISASGFGVALTANASLDISAFRSGAGITTANTSSQRFIYNSSNGALFFDADGNGAGNKIQIAILSGLPTLSNSDIFVLA
jgi:Ca2+-binding RTX toxin-like protein